MNPFGPRVRLAAAGAALLALAACDDRRGGVDAPEPPPLAELSATSELPYAPPAQVSYYAPGQGYAWAERAYGLQRAVYDTPPDYGFYYDDVEPLVWETGDDWVMYAEPWDQGYRYYYYEPGALYPYFVRDAEYGYGFGAGGVLIAVFDSGGRYLPVEAVYRAAPIAGRYYARGHDLRGAAGKARRVRVTDEVWAQRAPQVIRTADPWLRAARDERAWRAWRERDKDRELRRFEPEAERRVARTRQWREQKDRRELAAIQSGDRGGADAAARLQTERPRRPQVERPRREALRTAGQNQQRRAERQQRQFAEPRQPQVAQQRQQAERRPQIERQPRRESPGQRAPAHQRPRVQQAQLEQAQQGHQQRARSAQQQGRPVAARERGGHAKDKPAARERKG